VGRRCATPGPRSGCPHFVWAAELYTGGRGIFGDRDDPVTVKTLEEVNVKTRARVRTENARFFDLKSTSYENVCGRYPETRVDGSPIVAWAMPREIVGASRDYPQTVAPDSTEICLKNGLWTIPRSNGTLRRYGNEASGCSVGDTPMPEKQSKSVPTRHLRMFGTQFLNDFKAYQLVFALFYEIKIAV
jgi:hypothetical protein